MLPSSISGPGLGSRKPALKVIEMTQTNQHPAANLICRRNSYGSLKPEPAFFEEGSLRPEPGERAGELDSLRRATRRR